MKKYVAPFVVLLFALPVYAQVDLGQSLYLSSSAPYPKPNDPVTLTVQNPLVELSERIITWKNSGTVVLQGEGETIYRTTAPSSGERADITVTVEGLADTASLTIAPFSVDLMWESDSNTPGLYRGRHLPSLGSIITLQALPHVFQKGVEIPAAQLNFTWLQDGAVLTTGKGRSSLSFPVKPLVDTTSVTVRVTSADKTLGAENSADITVATPPVRLYIEHPLYGTMYHNALGASTHVSDTEMSFAAVPYFAKAASPNDPQFSYVWRVNRTTIDPNKDRPNTITINAGAGGGEAKIDLALSHKKNYQLDAEGSWTITFGSIRGAGAGEDLFTGQ